MATTTATTAMATPAPASAPALLPTHTSVSTTANHHSSSSSAAPLPPLLLSKLKRRSRYRDRQFRGTDMEYQHALNTSTTVYVGNLSFYTTEEQIWELFAQATAAPKPHAVKRITMGLNRETKTPCGFCFVEFHTRRAAEQAVAWVSGRCLDNRDVRVDLDWGFREGRQYGRGKSGGQVRDEFRMDYDEGRGGLGGAAQRERERDDFDDDDDAPNKRQRH
mmetsp:Transcript_10379/g.25967  ORF Transcript_10379/g.25967 Transcript_10379/m.25967 type:complete len:220 (+) Transcript_10379:267-926(+)